MLLSCIVGVWIEGIKWLFTEPPYSELHMKHSGNLHSAGFLRTKTCTIWETLKESNNVSCLWGQCCTEPLNYFDPQYIGSIHGTVFLIYIGHDSYGSKLCYISPSWHSYHSHYCSFKYISFTLGRSVQIIY